MRAVVQSRYGGPEDLAIGQVDPPAPRDDEVLVRVHAASVHADVWHVVAGHPRFLRLMGNGVRRPRHVVPGTDVSGVVVEVGAKVTRFDLGDEVFGETIRSHQWKNGGAWAELATAQEARVAHKPSFVSHPEAATVSTTGLIALDLLFGQARFVAGERVLVNGAGGAVGSMVVQIAKAFASHVTAVDSATRQTLLQQLGADEFIDYAQVDFTTLDARYDVIIDIPGNHTWARIRPRLTDDGRYVLVGHDGYDRTTNRLLGAMGQMLPLMVRSIWSPHLSGFSRAEPVQDRMATLLELLERRALTPVIARAYPLEHASDALSLVMSGEPIGRVVLTVDQSD